MITPQIIVWEFHLELAFIMLALFTVIATVFAGLFIINLAFAFRVRIRRMKNNRRMKELMKGTKS